MATQNLKKVECPLCNSSGNLEAKIAQADVWCCSACNMMFATGAYSRGTSSNVVDTDPEFFDQTILNYNSQKETARIILKTRIAEYEKMLKRPVRRVLEIGPGAGAYSEVFSEFGIRYVGVEIERKIGAATRLRTGQDIRLGDFLDIEIEGRFDVVFASQVFEHIAEPLLFLKKVKMVATNGLLHIDVPNHDSVVSVIRKWASKKEYGFIQPPYHMLAYTPQTLRFVLTKAELEIVLVKALPNNHAVWGQLLSKPSALNSIVYALSGLLGRGSLLTAVAKIPAP